MGWRSGGEETQGRPWDVTTAGPSSPQPPAHGPFPPQQEALPDETEVIEDPTTEVGGPAPPQHLPRRGTHRPGESNGLGHLPLWCSGKPPWWQPAVLLGFLPPNLNCSLEEAHPSALPKHPQGSGEQQHFGAARAELCAPRHTRTVLFCRSLWGQTPSRWRWGSSRNPQRM